MKNLNKSQNNMYYIGQIIKKYRKHLKWSQERLSLKANLDRTYIGKLERGQQNATIKSLTKIADALGINIFILIKEAENLKSSK